MFGGCLADLLVSAITNHLTYRMSVITRVYISNIIMKGTPVHDA